MRFLFSCTIVLLAVAMAFSQDTSFVNGPQYLTSSVPDARSTGDASFFVRPISTPSISLSSPLLEVGASNATGNLTVGADTQTVVALRAVVLPRTDLAPVLYGMPSANAIEISLSREAAQSNANREIPTSILDTGVTQIANAESLRWSGYGITLPEAAGYSKAHTRRATRIYTNADIDRLRGGM
jgi:hypothetical protein